MFLPSGAPPNCLDKKATEASARRPCVATVGHGLSREGGTYFTIILSSAFATDGYYVVCFEAVNQSPEAVLILFFELLNRKIGSDVCLEVELRPNFISCMEKFIGQHLCIHAVKVVV